MRDWCSSNLGRAASVDVALTASVGIDVASEASLEDGETVDSCDTGASEDVPVAW